MRDVKTGTKRATCHWNKEHRHKYTTHILIRSFLDPLRVRVKVSSCVASFVLCYVSHLCLCIASALCLRVTCVWCRYIRVSSLFFRVLVLFQSKPLQKLSCVTLTVNLLHFPVVVQRVPQLAVPSEHSQSHFFPLSTQPSTKSPFCGLWLVVFARHHCYSQVYRGYPISYDPLIPLIYSGVGISL